MEPPSNDQQSTAPPSQSQPGRQRHLNSPSDLAAELRRDRVVFRSSNGVVWAEMRHRPGGLERLSPETVFSLLRSGRLSSSQQVASAVFECLISDMELPLVRTVMRTPCLDEEWVEVSAGVDLDRSLYVAGAHSRLVGNALQLEACGVIGGLVEDEPSRTTLEAILLNAMWLPQATGTSSNHSPPTILSWAGHQHDQAVDLGRALGWLIDGEEPAIVALEPGTGPAAALSSAPRRDRRVVLLDLEGQREQLPSLLEDPEVAHLRRERPELLPIVIWQTGSLNARALIRTLMVSVGAPSNGPGTVELVNIAKDGREAVLKALHTRAIERGPTIQARRFHAKEVSLVPRDWARTIAAMTDPGFADARWIGRLEERDVVELYWLGRLHSGPARKVDEWLELAHGAGLPGSVICCRDDEDRARLAALLAAAADRSLLEVEETLEVRRVGDDCYQFIAVDDPLDALFEENLDVHEA